MQETTPKATHVGEIELGAIKIPCAVLENGTRLVTQEGFLNAMGRAKKAKGGHGASVAKLPPFLAANNLKPFISQELEESTKPIRFKNQKGTLGWGYNAELLPRVCQVYLEARDAKELLHSQIHIAQKADLLIRALAHVGIIALVDEATGYQYDRDRQALNKILEAYIAKELLPWAKRFPDEYYKELFRLRGWQYSPLTVARPAFIGKLTNQIIYDRLPPGVKVQLQKQNPTDPDNKRRKYKHHQFLTYDLGLPHLEKLLVAVIALMKASPNWSTFHRLFSRAFPKPGDQLELDLEE